MTGVNNQWFSSNMLLMQHECVSMLPEGYCVRRRFYTGVATKPQLLPSFCLCGLSYILRTLMYISFDTNFPKIFKWWIVILQGKEREVISWGKINLIWLHIISLFSKCLDFTQESWTFGLCRCNAVGWWSEGIDV